MTKIMSPIWFLQDPLDPEHKEYLLLDYLKNVSKNLNKENCWSIMREISKMVRILNDFRREKKIPEFIVPLLKGGDKKIYKSFIYQNLEEDDIEKVTKIIEDSLQTLYCYSEVCLDILKEEESKIKIFKIESKSVIKSQHKNSGIVIIRNMVTDRLLNYFFKTRVKMETPDGKKEISILKKIHLKNKFFSLNYEYIYHEILEEIDSEERYSPQFYVIEIYENFEEESEIYKIAKEKFIDQIEDQNQI